MQSQLPLTRGCMQKDFNTDGIGVGRAVKEAEIRVIQPQTKEYWQPPEAG